MILLTGNKVEVEMTVEEALRLIQDLSKGVEKCLTIQNGYGWGTYPASMVKNANDEKGMPSALKIRVVKE